MKLVTWILISISILTLLFLRCPCENIYENMEAADAVSIANEYIDNLTKQRDAASDNATNTQLMVDETNVRLADANAKLNAATNPDDRTKYIDEITAITAELTKYQKLVVNYTKEAERFNSLIIETQATADKLDEEVGNIPTENDLDGIAFVPGPDNTMVELKPTGDLGGAPTYYEPGTYKFGSATYVPSYEDSVYLSKTTGQSSVSTYLDKATMMGGACSYFKDQPDKLEEMCNSIDTNNCGAMSCCVLLGGAKCVSGNKSGPYNKLNYGDITVRDKDYYYHNGKCYGNCK